MPNASPPLSPRQPLRQISLCRKRHGLQGIGQLALDKGGFGRPYATGGPVDMLNHDE